MARTVPQLKRGYETAKAEQTNWLSVWRDAYRYCLPQRDIIDKPRPGQQRGFLVFDSTAVGASKRFATRIQDAMFPPDQDFVELLPGPLIPKEQQADVRKKLQEVSAIFHSLVHRSNFRVSVNEFLLELVVGTAAMMIEEGEAWDPFVFVPVATPMIYVSEGKWGTVGTIYRQICKPLSVVIKEWPDLEIPADWKDKARNDPDMMVEFCDAAYEDDETQGKWYYTCFRPDQGDELLKKAREYGGMSPWIVTRWEKAPGETFGRGPAIDALPDIRTANRVVELILANASLSVAGVYTGVSDGVLNPNTARFVPGTIIPVARNTGHPMGPSLVPLERSGDFDVSQVVLDDQRMSIKQLMYDRTLPPDLGPVRSATEIVARQRELAINNGPAFARMRTEFIQPMVLRCLQIMQRKKLIDFPPQIDGQYIQLNIVSPLAKEQNLAKVDALANWLMFISQLGPEMVALGAVVEDMPQYVAELMSVDQKLVRTEAERSQMQQMVAQMLATRMAQQQQAANPAGTAPPGSPTGAPV